MLFSSTTFLYLFLPAVLFFYFIVFKKKRILQNIFLLLASLFFYAWGEHKRVLIMILSIFINWLFGLLISKKKNDRRLCKLLLIIDIIINLSVLFFFKYLSFTGSIINSIFGAQLDLPVITLPIGISFFTFQAMSYVIDVYRQKGKAQTNILNVGLYISFFPQLIAGPIVRYETIADQIINRKETLDGLFNGFARFVIGLSKKVLLANSFSIVADQAFALSQSGESISVAFSWLGAIAYSLQILFDFSGYSDMAIGLGEMFGFRFLENFNYPYISTSITDFWRRWHISLGTWFRDYVYIPLGGNRCSKLRNFFNLFVVWALTGLWHGANYTVIIWGLMYFVLLVIEKITDINKKGKNITTFLKWCYTCFFVIIGWVLFRSDSIGSAVSYLGSMFGINGNPFVDGKFTGWFTQNLILLLIGFSVCTPLYKILGEKTKDNHAAGIIKTAALICLFVLSAASLISNSYNPFIYFNF